jgi:hypothetical protein
VDTQHEAYRDAKSEKREERGVSRCVEPVEVPFLPLLYGKSGQGFWELAQ